MNKTVNKLLHLQDQVMRDVPVDAPKDDQRYNDFRLKASAVRSQLEAEVRGQRGEEQLLKGLWSRADYTNDLLLAILNDGRHAVSAL